MNPAEERPKNVVESREILISFTPPIGLALIYLALILYALNWRVANEPGFSTVWELLLPAIAFCGLGGLILVASHIYLIIRRSRLLLISWGLCIMVTIGAASIAPIVLLLMV